MLLMRDIKENLAMLKYAEHNLNKAKQKLDDARIQYASDLSDCALDRVEPDCVIYLGRALKQLMDAESTLRAAETNRDLLNTLLELDIREAGLKQDEAEAVRLRTHGKDYDEIKEKMGLASQADAQKFTDGAMEKFIRYLAIVRDAPCVDEEFVDNEPRKAVPDAVWCHAVLDKAMGELVYATEVAREQIKANPDSDSDMWEIHLQAAATGKLGTAEWYTKSQSPKLVAAYELAKAAATADAAIKLVQICEMPRGLPYTTLAKEKALLYEAEEVFGFIPVMRDDEPYIDTVVDRQSFGVKPPKYIIDAIWELEADSADPELRSAVFDYFIDIGIINEDYCPLDYEFKAAEKAYLDYFHYMWRGIYATPEDFV